eukprot:13282839-Alexandrium_andersonii.AAC.1
MNRHCNAENVAHCHHRSSAFHFYDADAQPLRAVRRRKRSGIFLMFMPSLFRCPELAMFSPAASFLLLAARSSARNFFWRREGHTKKH